VEDEGGAGSKLRHTFKSRISPREWFCKWHPPPACVAYIYSMQKGVAQTARV